jgi:RNA polymerase sigma factor (TIGR02999 family)
VEQAQHWDSRGHFFAAAAEAMRRILIDNARRKQAEKHGGGQHRVELTEAYTSGATPEELLLLDDALAGLLREDPAAGAVAKLRLFAGLSVEQAGEALGIGRATAFRHWTYARAWLHAQLHDDGGS